MLFYVTQFMGAVEWKESYIMATADVASLYTIISHSDGFGAVELFLKRDVRLLSIQKDFVLSLLKFAISHNFFWFGGSFYL